MHDEHLSETIKSAGESFAPPRPDVQGIVRRGRHRKLTTRPLAIAASVVLIAAGAAGIARIDLSEPVPKNEPAIAAAAALSDWAPIADSPLKPRYGALAVWTGDQFLVSGGYHSVRRDALDGASYDPARDEWTKLPPSPAEVSMGRSAVWTGKEMILWGGEFGNGSHAAPDTGFAYDPATRTWRPLPEAPYWSLAGHVAAWTGTEMIVWGGVTADDEPAAAYDPATNTWRSLPVGPMGSRHGAAGVWAGDRLIVWGGNSQDGVPVPGPEGAAFDPASGEWTEIPESPLGDVSNVVTAWTGADVIVVGGLSTTQVPNRGAAYNPGTGTWREIARVPAASGRDDAPIPMNELHTQGHWTGEHVVFVTGDGVVAYSPADDEWSYAEAPDAAHVGGAITAWTGDALLVWGGRAWDSKDFAEGGWIARR